MFSDCDIVSESLSDSSSIILTLLFDFMFRALHIFALLYAVFYHSSCSPLHVWILTTIYPGLHDVVAILSEIYYFRDLSILLIMFLHFFLSYTICLYFHHILKGIINTPDAWEAFPYENCIMNSTWLMDTMLRLLELKSKEIVWATMARQKQQKLSLGRMWKVQRKPHRVIIRKINVNEVSFGNLASGFSYSWACGISIFGNIDSFCSFSSVWSFG